MSDRGNRPKTVRHVLGSVVISLCVLLRVAGAQPCVEPPDGVISWWRGDGNAREVVAGHPSTLRGGTTFAPGIVGEAFHFAGTDAFVGVRDSDLWTFGTQDFTVELWVNFAQIQGRDPFMSHDVGPGGRNKWIFWYDELGHGISGPALRFHINSPTLGPQDPIIAPWTPTVGQWYHVAVTRGGSTYTLYIDGAPVATATHTAAIPDAAVPLTIGRAEAYFLQGLIDEPALFTRALTAAEIHAIFTAGSAGKCGFAGGQALGVNPVQVVCTNLTTGQTVTSPQGGAQSWRCPGLVINPGDSIRQTVRGRAQ